MLGNVPNVQIRSIRRLGYIVPWGVMNIINGIYGFKLSARIVICREWALGTHTYGESRYDIFLQDINTILCRVILYRNN